MTAFTPGVITRQQADLLNQMLAGIQKAAPTLNVGQPEGARAYTTPAGVVHTTTKPPAVWAIIRGVRSTGSPGGINNPPRFLYYCKEVMDGANGGQIIREGGWDLPYQCAEVNDSYVPVGTVVWVEKDPVDNEMWRFDKEGETSSGDDSSTGGVGSICGDELTVLLDVCWRIGCDYGDSDSGTNCPDAANGCQSVSSSPETLIPLDPDAEPPTDFPVIGFPVIAAVAEPEPCQPQLVKLFGTLVIDPECGLKVSRSWCETDCYLRCPTDYFLCDGATNVIAKTLRAQWICPCPGFGFSPSKFNLYWNDCGREGAGNGWYWPSPCDGTLTECEATPDGCLPGPNLCGIFMPGVCGVDFVVPGFPSYFTVRNELGEIVYELLPVDCGYSTSPDWPRCFTLPVFDIEGKTTPCYLQVTPA